MRNLERVEDGWSLVAAGWLQQRVVRPTVGGTPFHGTLKERPKKTQSPERAQDKQAGQAGW